MIFVLDSTLKDLFERRIARVANYIPDSPGESKLLNAAWDVGTGTLSLTPDVLIASDFAPALRSLVNRIYSLRHHEIGFLEKGMLVEMAEMISQLLATSIVEQAAWLDEDFTPPEIKFQVAERQKKRRRR